MRSKVVQLEAKECGTPCAVTPKQIDAELASIRKANFANSQAKFDTYLTQRGISAADARDIVKTNLLQTALVNHVTRGVRFTAADAKQYYDANPAQFKVAAGRTASHILVATKAQADKIRAEVTTANFAALAKKYSTDTGSAKQGGSLGQIQKGQLVARVREGRLRAEERRDLGPGQDAVRLAHHHRDDHPRADHLVRRGEGPDHLQPAGGEAPVGVRRLERQGAEELGEADGLQERQPEARGHHGPRRDHRSRRLNRPACPACRGTSLTA